MILASHYVIQDILQTLKSGDKEELAKVCRKYSKRYSKDNELAMVCGMVLEDEEMGKEKTGKMESKLADLMSARKIEGSGGSHLWYKDARKIQ